MLLSGTVVLCFSGFNVHSLTACLVSSAHMVGFPGANNPAVKPTLSLVHCNTVCGGNPIYCTVLGILHVQCFSNYGNKTFAVRFCEMVTKASA